MIISECVGGWGSWLYYTNERESGLGLLKKGGRKNKVLLMGV